MLVKMNKSHFKFILESLSQMTCDFTNNRRKIISYVSQIFKEVKLVIFLMKNNLKASLFIFTEVSCFDDLGFFCLINETV